MFSEIWSALAEADASASAGSPTADAFVDIIAATILYDESTDQSELDYAYSFMESALEVDNATARSLVDGGMARVRERGVDGTMSHVATVLTSAEDRRTGYMAALGVSKAESGWFGSGEEGFLEGLASALNLGYADTTAVEAELSQLLAEDATEAEESSGSDWFSWDDDEDDSLDGEFGKDDLEKIGAVLARKSKGGEHEALAQFIAQFITHGADSDIIERQVREFAMKDNGLHMWRSVRKTFGITDDDLKKMGHELIKGFFETNF